MLIRRKKISRWKLNGPYSFKVKIPITLGCFVLSLVLQKIIFKVCQYIFTIISPWKRAWPFIWTNMISHHPRMLCAKFGWNWHCGSKEKFFSWSMYRYFCYFRITSFSSWKWVGFFICTNLIPHYPRMLCDKLGWNWSCGSWEEDF